MHLSIETTQQRMLSATDVTVFRSRDRQHLISRWWVVQVSTSSRRFSTGNMVTCTAMTADTTTKDCLERLFEIQTWGEGMIFGSAKLTSTRQLSMGISQAYTAAEDDITKQNNREKPFERQTWSLDVSFTGQTHLSTGDLSTDITLVYAGIAVAFTTQDSLERLPRRGRLLEIKIHSAAITIEGGSRQVNKCPPRHLTPAD